ncbi:structural cement protein Gp24 [Oligella urethralis]|uniref:structural cement protein Gp24 n=1 Tax=Oligella urethralis TaxID=90245 RepID=UPI0028892845|nr:hypothetical protein [Oligella urethralis]
MAITGGYTLNHSDRYAGMVVDGQVNNTVSKVNKTASVIAFGLFVARDGDDGFKAIDGETTAADVIGVLRRELNHVQSGGVSGVEAGRDGSVLTAGTIYVQSVGAVTQGAAVHVDTAGKAATAGVAIPGAKFLETTSSDGIVPISLVIGG